MANIPEQYQKYWEPFTADKPLLHVTTKENYEKIKQMGYIEPRDPDPQHWAGMEAIFLSDPDDPLYPESLKKLLTHTKETREELVRLYIKTTNQLYKSNARGRTFHIMTLEPISIEEIIKSEPVI